MCGICGIIEFGNEEVNRDDIQRMSEKLVHRGPDDSGLYCQNNVGLGFRRLSIIDLTQGGHQPMISKDGNYIIVFNGEIYNYLELREELKGQGVIFQSNSDTEVLLQSYIQWGDSLQEKLNGMWAFAIYDKKKNEIFCSRDRFGVKPFYYFNDSDRFYFSSEIPPLLKATNFKAEVNDGVVYNYLVYGRTDYSTDTFFKGIKKIDSGQCLKIDLNSRKFHFRKWYDLKNIKISDKKGIESTFKKSFENSIDKQMRSDVEIGVCLSGGLDSSVILANLLKKRTFGQVQTFSVVFPEQTKYDESVYIKEFEKSNCHQSFIKPNLDEFIEEINELIKCQAEPFSTTSIYSQFKLMQFIKASKIKVTLDGQGADEQLGGYKYFHGIFLSELLRLRRFKNLVFELSSYVKDKNFTAIKYFIFYNLPAILKQFFFNSKTNFLSPKFKSKFRKETNLLSKLYEFSTFRGALIQHLEYKLEHLLKWSDRNSMYHSIESRVPFLDHNVVESSLNLALDDFFSKGVSKKILRASFNDILPVKICNRKDKIGFESPEAEWFRSDKAVDYIREILNSNSFRSRKFFNTKAVNQIFDEHLQKKSEKSKVLWRIICLEIWLRIFIDEEI